jgi:hypothetical protein
MDVKRECHEKSDLRCSTIVSEDEIHVTFRRRFHEISDDQE